MGRVHSCARRRPHRCGSGLSERDDAMRPEDALIQPVLSVPTVVYPACQARHGEVVEIVRELYALAAFKQYVPEAARQALTRAGVPPPEINAVLVETTPALAMPGVAF